MHTHNHTVTRAHTHTLLAAPAPVGGVHTHTLTHTHCPQLLPKVVARGVMIAGGLHKEIAPKYFRWGGDGAGKD